MRKAAVWTALVMAGGWGASPLLLAQATVAAGAGAGGPTVLEQAPKDRSIAIPKEKLAQHLKDMDAKKLHTLRMLEGGKYNVNLRRLTAAESALVQPLTAGLWVVLEGAGTLVTGGVLEAGKINGGRTRSIKAGDLIYLPSGLPHGITGVNGTLAWMDVRWDTDWPTDAPMGAGTTTALTVRAAAAAGAAAPGGAAPQGAPAAGGRGGRPPGSQASLPFSYGGSGEQYFPREMLEQTMAGMRLTRSSNTRLVEGGRYNINLRWQGTPSAEVHDQTIDVWYLLAGGGTINTGFQMTNRQRVAGTGVSVPAKPGDVFYHPSSLYHGYSEVAPDVFWLNIRWDDNYRKD